MPPHQPMAPLPVELRLYLGTHGCAGAWFQNVENLIGQRALARVDHPPGADPTCIAGLPATERIENGSVELDRIAVHRGDGRLARLEIRVLAENEFRHQCSSTASATTKTTSEPAAKNISVVGETSGRSGSRGTGGG